MVPCSNPSQNPQIRNRISFNIMESTDSSTASKQPQPQLPPGFRFHPTDEELVVQYLKKRIAAAPLPVAIIAEVDIYKFDPWELPEKSIFGEHEWYFFTPRDRKYPNGARPNRAATSGYWKATGTDKPVTAAGGTQKVGVKKALVFYTGKPPKGTKTSWIMHEYRLADNKSNSKNPPASDFGNKNRSLRLDDWVLCRIYKKMVSQGTIEQEKDEQIIGSSIPRGISMPIGQQKLMENGSGLYEGMPMMSSDSIHSHHLGLSGISRASPFALESNDLIHAKRTLIPNLYWNDELGNEDSQSTKRLLCENSCIGRNDEATTSCIGNIQASQMGNLGDGVFGQQAYVLGLNWFS